MVHHLSYPIPFNDSLYSLIPALSYDKNEDEVTVVGVEGAQRPRAARAIYDKVILFLFSTALSP